MAIELATIRSARATNDEIDGLEGRLPLFVHKWTKKRRRYELGDLQLPATLFFRGLWPQDSLTVGVGGTRSPAVETFCLVSQVVKALAAEGATIISGGVPGVDLAGHLGAVDSSLGTTIAVMANPVELGLKGHEWSSQLLEDAMLVRGGFLSEYAESVAIWSDAYRERLLERDRIISGLCDVFVVFECNVGSATVDTARRAIAQGKKVVCVRSSCETLRRGIDELLGEYDLESFDAVLHTPSYIAQRILSQSQHVFEISDLRPHHTK